MPSILLLLAGCGANLFTLEDDRQLGLQLKEEIENDPVTYPPVDPEEYPEAYAELERIGFAVLDSGAVDLRDEFDWEFHLIHDDDTLNAFCAPGGYVWVYTGLIRYVDSEDTLAGVLGHEIGHADNRHTTEQLTEVYGVQVLLEIALGERGELLQQIATGLAALSFSRADERESDASSVRYLCETEYAADGAAGFFEALADEAEPPEFLSTHPSSASRVDDIEAMAADLGCSTTPSGNDYQAVLDAMP